MKCFALLLALLLPGAIYAQKPTTDISTTGDNSPAVVAKNFSVQYGVREDAIYALLRYYEKDEPDAQKRKNRVEQLIKKYSQTPERKNKAAALGENSKKQLGLNTEPAVVSALEWDLFATKNYLSTFGANSPAVNAPGGEVNIWYGISPTVVRALADVLEKNKTSIADLEAQLKSLVKKYEELKAELEAYGVDDPIIKKAQLLLDEGKLQEVEQLLDNNLDLQDKRLAYRHYFDGGVKELLLKYDQAATHYYKSVVLDPENSRYLLKYAFNEHTRAHYDEAILYFQKALAIDTIASKDKPEKAAVLFNNLGGAWQAKGEYDRAIAFFEKALAIDSIAFGNKHPNVATRFNNLGTAWHGKGVYDRAMTYFLKALAIDSANLDNNPQNIVRDHNNIGNVWNAKGDYDRALNHFETAFSIDSSIFCGKSPNASTLYNNLGLTWRYKGENNLALSYYEKALSIDSTTLGTKHPKLARCYNNIGLIWNDKGDPDRAISYFEKALGVDTVSLGRSHSLIAVLYNNIGLALDSKGEYDLAIYYYEKALQIDTNILGSKHSNIANYFNNIGSSYQAKGDFDQAIALFEKALQIDSLAYGSCHKNIAIDFNNLGTALQGKGEYDRAVAFFEKCQAIQVLFFEPQHPFREKVAKKLSRSANDRGIEFLYEKKYVEARLYFQKALENAEATEDWFFSLAFLYNIGSINKKMGDYAAGLSFLEKGIKRSEELDKKSGKPENAAVLRTMRYHIIGCLAGLNRKEEAATLAKQLKAEAEAAGDQHTLDDLKKDGWIK